MQEKPPFKLSSVQYVFFAHLLVLISVFSLYTASAQDSTAVRYKINAKVKPAPAFATSTPTYYSRNVLIDSLNSMVYQMNARQDSLVQLLKNQRESIRESEAEQNRLSQENKNLQAELDGAMGDNLQSNHTNSILFIFNIIIGVILLIALLWMLLKRKNEPTVSKRTSGLSASVSTNGGSEQFDKELERIEKLGSLREKGLLTDEEFILQKKQILGEKDK